MTEFNPNDIGVANGNFFGLPFTVDESDVVLIPVPWDVTTSYMEGTANAPEAIINASVQVDLFDENIPKAWEAKIGTVNVSKEIAELGRESRIVAESIIGNLSVGKIVNSNDLNRVNNASEKLNEYVYSKAISLLNKGKSVGVVGGDHSVPLGLVKALSEQHNNFGVLHIDAHADLRKAYEGFTYSHASIMYNILNEVPQVSQITQVAVRDFCSDEHDIMLNNNRVHSFTNNKISSRMFKGENWQQICDDIINSLPDKIYISFDIDGLMPSLCPNTGTPVPGGLEYMQAMYLLETCVASGKKIIGFDLCEVAGISDTESIDANIGARVLYKLSLLLWKQMNNGK